MPLSSPAAPREPRPAATGDAYTPTMDLWPLTIEARRSLLSTFEQFDDEDWDIPSLCGGWSMREMLAHLVLAARPPARRYIAAVAKAKGNFDRANHHLAVEDARRSTVELISNYRAVVDHRFAPPGWPAAAPLSDVLLHSLDVRIPLGLPTDQSPPEHYEPVMGLLLSRAGRSFTRRQRPAVHWVATDHDWSHGDGQEVSGAMSSLALAAAGRRARLDHLEGQGVAALEAWLSQ